MNKPAQLQLGLENCETLVFDWCDVNSVVLHDLADMLTITNDGSKITHTHCKGFLIDVNIDGGYYLLDNDSSHWKKRLEKGDITSVCFVYENNRETYFVDWADNSDDLYHDHQGVNIYEDSAIIYCGKDFK